MSPMLIEELNLPKYAISVVNKFVHNISLCKSMNAKCQSYKALMMMLMMAFSSLARILEEGHSFPACAFKTTKFKMGIGLCRQIPLSRPGSVHIGSVS